MASPSFLIVQMTILGFHLPVFFTYTIVYRRGKEAVDLSSFRIGIGSCALCDSSWCRLGAVASIDIMILSFACFQVILPL